MFIYINPMFNKIHSQEPSMERITAVASECFFVNQNGQRVIMDNKAVTTLINILKDCLMMSVVVMIGATLTLLLG
jgi:hypothetical protein